MDECVFCSAELRELALYQDDKCFVILDKYPTSRGHMLVITNEHYTDILAAPDDLVEYVYKTAKKIAINAREKLNATGININTNIGRAANQLVMHCHVHVIPKYDTEPENFTKNVQILDQEKGKLTVILKLNAD